MTAPATAPPDVTAACDRLAAALADSNPGRALAALAPPGEPERRDRLCSLRLVYGLHLGPIERASALQNHPVVAAWKWELEHQWLAELTAADAAHRSTLPGDPVEALRALAARDRLPEVYQWAARQAGLAGLTRFLELEGGPDGGFDDLVAVCQVGLPPRPKMELARNYWDEMGNGDPAAVHGHLHALLAGALGLKEVDDDPALARSLLPGLLATNRWLQPEMLGALGLIELQAGPRSRLVARGLARVGAPAACLPFYEVHAEVDPRHGVNWLDEAIIPLIAEHPRLAERIVRGALWRSRTNAELFSGPSVAALMELDPPAERGAAAGRGDAAR